jgi:hypothetical protein
MAFTGYIKGVKSLLRNLETLKRVADHERSDSVEVVYTSRYAVYVHENPEMKLKGKPRPSGLGNYWGPEGQSKFLIGPAYSMVPELRRIIAKVYTATGSLTKGLLLAGLRLQSASQKVVPVEHSNLRASADTRIVKGKI